MKHDIKIKDADDLISTMDKNNEGIMKFFEVTGRPVTQMKFVKMCHNSDMIYLVHCEDRKIALEAFNKLDAERREGVVGALRSSIENLEEELDRRSKGIPPKPDSRLVNSSDEGIRKTLEGRYNFASELGLE